MRSEVQVTLIDIAWIINSTVQSLSASDSNKLGYRIGTNLWRGPILEEDFQIRQVDIIWAALAQNV